MELCERTLERQILSIRPNYKTMLRCLGRLVHGDGAEALQRALMSTEEMHIVLDLSRVEAIDAAGIGVLVALSKWSHKRGGSLQLLNPNPRVLERLQTTGVDAVLDICWIVGEKEKHAVV